MKRVFENLTEVKSLKKCKLNLNYYTNNHSIFKVREDNRSGLDSARVNNFVREIKNGTYDYDMSNICIQVDGKIGEGTHRVRAHESTNTPILSSSNLPTIGTSEVHQKCCYSYYILSSISIFL